MEEVRKVVEALMRVGPRFSDISRATGIPISTVRYILLKKLPKLGLSIRASINYGALGLQRYLVEFRSDYPPHYISKILDLLGEYMYLDYYTYSMTGKKFLAIFAVPPRYEKDFLDFLGDVSAFGLISEFTVHKLVYMRAIPFMVEFFDFSRGLWLQDWISKPKTREIPEIPEYPDLNPKIDKLDLILLSNLQIKVIPIKYSELARKLNLTRQTISKHFKHLKEFISLFTVFWFPPMNPELLLSPLLIRADARSEARRILLSIPFTFTEFRGEADDYFAMLLVPSVGLYITLKFLTSSVELTEINFQDMDFSGKFRLQHSLFQRGSWINPFEMAAEKLLEIAQKRRGSL